MSAALLRRVVVLAGEAELLAAVAATAIDAGALVALVSPTLPATTPTTVRFNANPAEPDVWGRIAMHVEQHLGPVDAVVGDATVAPVLRSVFAADLARRGRDPVVVAQAGDTAEHVVTRLARTPPATRSRPGAADPDL